jgi:hypothetical protein
MSLSPNLTNEHLDAVMDALPEEMNEAELCALTLTIFTAYTDDTADVMSGLTACLYTFGATRGMSSSMVSMGLRMSADMHDEKPKRKH